jgi:hypothetical protein
MKYTVSLIKTSFPENGKALAEYIAVDNETKIEIKYFIESISLFEDPFYYIGIKRKKGYVDTLAYINGFPNNCGVAIISNIRPNRYYVNKINSSIFIPIDLIFHMAYSFIANNLGCRFAIYTASEYQVDLVNYLNKNWQNNTKFGRNFNSNNLIYMWTKDLKDFSPESEGIDFNVFDNEAFYFGDDY